MIVPVTRAEIEEQGVSTTVPFAGRALGMAKDRAYDLARTGELAPGVPVIRVGDRYVVPTAPLRRVLGLDGAAEAGGNAA